MGKKASALGPLLGGGRLSVSYNVSKFAAQPRARCTLGLLIATPLLGGVGCCLVPTLLELRAVSQGDVTCLFREGKEPMLDRRWREERDGGGVLTDGVASLAHVESAYSW